MKFIAFFISRAFYHSMTIICGIYWKRFVSSLYSGCYFLECYYSIRQTLQYHTYTTSDKEIVCQDGMKTYILPRDVLFF